MTLPDLSRHGMKKLLFVGDAGVPSGFARATHNILDTICKHYDVTVLGLNYRGDPDVRRLYPYDIWSAAAGGDVFGVQRLIWMCDTVKPDVIVLQNDGWNLPPYLQRLRTRLPNGEYAFPEYAGIPVVAIVAVDGKNFQSHWLDGVQEAVFWTQFALDEARDAGYRGPARVIPLGVDIDIYHPVDKRSARLRREFPEPLHDAFVVGNVNRNQPRKRWDLTIRYFAEWIQRRNIRDAYLYLHVAPTGDTGCNVKQLTQYYGVHDRVALYEPATFYGPSEEDLAEVYNCLDVVMSTSQGEGFGLTAIEAMACGVPCIVPDWAALGDWAKGAVELVPCPTTHSGPPYVNVIGGVPDQEVFVSALDRMYLDRAFREEMGQKALNRAYETRFSWRDIGERYLELLSSLVAAERAEEVVA